MVGKITNLEHLIVSEACPWILQGLKNSFGRNWNQSFAKVTANQCVSHVSKVKYKQYSPFTNIGLIPILRIAKDLNTFHNLPKFN